MQNKKKQDYKVLLTVSLQHTTAKNLQKEGDSNGKAVAEIPLKIKHKYFGNP